MGINKEQALGKLGVLRQFANAIPYLEYFPSIIGLGDGLLRRELIMSGLYHEELDGIPDSPQKSAWEDILTLAKVLPQPFWIGLHPYIARQLRTHLDQPESEFWSQPIKSMPIPIERPAIIPTEPNMNLTQGMQQVEFINQFLPQNSVRSFF